jgi:hypothetical protein
MKPFKSSITVNGNVTATGMLVGASASIAGILNMGTDLAIAGDPTFPIVLNADGGIYINTSTATVFFADLLGNVTLSGTLNVSGDTYASGTIYTNNVTTSNLSVSGSSGVLLISTGAEVPLDINGGVFLVRNNGTMSSTGGSFGSITIGSDQGLDPENPVYPIVLNPYGGIFLQNFGSETLSIDLGGNITTQGGIVATGGLTCYGFATSDGLYGFGGDGTITANGVNANDVTAVNSITAAYAYVTSDIAVTGYANVGYGLTVTGAATFNGGINMNPGGSTLDVASGTIVGASSIETTSLILNGTPIGDLLDLKANVSALSSYLTTASASSTYAPKASPTFTGTMNAAGITATGTVAAATLQQGSSSLNTILSSYLLSSTAATNYAPKASPAFTGTATFNIVDATDLRQGGTSLNTTLANYLTTSSAAATYAPKASPTFTGIVASTGSTGAFRITDRTTSATYDIYADTGSLRIKGGSDLMTFATATGAVGITGAMQVDGLVDLTPNHATAGDYAAVTIGKNITALSGKRPKLRIYGSVEDTVKSFCDIGMHYWGWVEFSSGIKAARFIHGGGDNSGYYLNGNQNAVLLTLPLNTTQRGAVMLSTYGNSSDFSRNFILGDIQADYSTSTTISAALDPTLQLYAQSATSDWTRYTRLSHDGTNTCLKSGKGSVKVDAPTGLDIPVLSGHPAAPATGYVRLYAIGSAVYAQTSGGTQVLLG